MATCAYCGSTNRKMTGEHIFPAWAFRVNPQWTMKYVGRLDKLVGSDHVINDVCEDCNSRVLSKLDDYAKTLWHEFFSESALPGTGVTFVYDYDKLARWLLKVAYNDSRASLSQDRQALASLVRYILGDDFRPTGLVIGLRLIAPHKLTNEEFEILGEKERGILVDHAIPPSGVQIVAIDPLESEGQLSVVRSIIINSYQFIILVPQGYYAKLLRRASYMEREVRFGKDIMVLLPDKSAVAVGTSTITSLNLMAGFVSTHPDLAKSVPKKNTTGRKGLR